MGGVLLFIVAVLGIEDEGCTLLTHEFCSFLLLVSLHGFAIFTCTFCFFRFLNYAFDGMLCKCFDDGLIV